MKRVFLILLLLPLAGWSDPAFRAGVAVRDITPEKPIPMWGYSVRHDLPGKAALDPLMAQALVLELGGKRLALVSLDLGRAPTAKSTARIRAAAAAQAAIDRVLLCASHTHHGPVLELVDEPGKGQGKHDDAVDYVRRLEDTIVETIVEAAGKLVEARVGWASSETALNRNRQWKPTPRPVDPELFVLRVDNIEGNPLAVLVNFAAHPTIHSLFDMRWSAEWPGAMRRVVEMEFGAPCLFAQGAAGDMSPVADGKERSIEAFGWKMAAAVLPLVKSIETKVPSTSELLAEHNTFRFKTRLDFNDAFAINVLQRAFFPELVAMLDEVEDNTIQPEMTVLLLNKELALVTASGEFFCQHAKRLKAESPAKETIFLGYCNGHHMYFPTREALEMGGSSTEPAMAWAEAGAGEAMTEWALGAIEALNAEAPQPVATKEH